MHTALMLVLLHIICVIQATLSSSSAAIDTRVNLRHRDHPRSMTGTERFRTAIQRSNKRVESIEAVIHQASQSKSPHATTNDAFQTPLAIGKGEYLMEVGVGSPVVKFEAIADTGSDLVWTKCLPCENCSSQPTRIFDPSKSSTYSTAPCTDSHCSELKDFKTGCSPACSYTYKYVSGSSSGVLSYDTLTIGDEGIVNHVAFGCAHDSKGEGFQGEGLVGLGRGPLSLISQLGNMGGNKFSYCLLDSFNDPQDATSPMFFGDSAKLSGGQTLTLKQSSAVPTFWYLPLTGVTVAGKAVDIPKGSFDLQPNGRGGMIIDSGTPVTYFIPAAYTPFVDSIKPHINLTAVDGSSTGLDLCYDVSAGTDNLSLPTVTLNFEGGVDMALPTANYFHVFNGRTLCLLIKESTESPSILGSTQQQNFHILYDNAQNTLSFKPERCASM